MKFLSLNKSVGKKTGFFVSVAMFAVLGISLFVFLMVIESGKRNDKKVAVEELSDLLAESITFTMSEGSTDVSPLIAKTKKINNIADLRIIPTDLIDADKAAEMDAIEKEIVNSKKIYESPENWNSMEVYRSTIPILAEEGCLSCHDDAKTGSTLAVVTMRYSMVETYAAVSAMRWQASLLVLLTVGIVIFVILLIFKKNILTDLLRSVNCLKMLEAGDVKAEININREDEIGNLANIIKKLKNSMKMQAETVHELSEGNFNVEVKVLSDEDVLGKAVDSIKSTLVKLKSDTNYLIEAALEGRLSERADAKRHSGEFRAIVDGINKTLDALMTPTNNAVQILLALAENDLTKLAEGNYNGDHKILINNINAVVYSLRKIIFDVAAAVEKTKSSSYQISASAEQIAAGAIEQSSQATEIAGAAEEMTKTIFSTAESSQLATEAARNAGSLVKMGAEKVNNSKAGMEKIVLSTEETAKMISSLANRTDQISEITSVINDIADQTNLLALNAAIEAARAGEQGRGFAVVADEVRKLAERTTKATNEIADTINLIQTEAKNADFAMKEASSSVEYGMKLNTEVDAGLKEILVSIDQVIEQIEQVATASEEQSKTAEEIGRTIEAISTVTNQTAGGVQEVARAAEDLNILTDNLFNLVNIFKMNNQNQKALESNNKIPSFS